MHSHMRRAFNLQLCSNEQTARGTTHIKTSNGLLHATIATAPFHHHHRPMVVWSSSDADLWSRSFFGVYYANNRVPIHIPKHRAPNGPWNRAKSWMLWCGWMWEARTFNEEWDWFEVACGKTTRTRCVGKRHPHVVWEILQWGGGLCGLMKG